MEKSCPLGLFVKLTLRPFSVGDSELLMLCWPILREESLDDHARGFCSIKPQLTHWRKHGAKLLFEAED